MDIESKRYRVRSLGSGQLELRAKSSGRVHYCPTSRLPGAHELARIHEHDFDTLIRREMS